MSIKAVVKVFSGGAGCKVGLAKRLNRGELKKALLHGYSCKQ